MTDAEIRRFEMTVFARTNSIYIVRSFLRNGKLRDEVFGFQFLDFVSLIKLSAFSYQHNGVEIVREKIYVYYSVNS